MDVTNTLTEGQRRVQDRIEDLRVILKAAQQFEGNLSREVRQLEPGVVKAPDGMEDTIIRLNQDLHDAAVALGVLTGYMLGSMGPGTGGQDV